MVPLCDLQQQYLQLKAELDAAMQEVAASGHYVLGPNVKALEREVANYCGAKHAIGVNSGTDALHLVLRSLDIGPGDEVVTTPFTFIATTEAIGMVGATPRFVDVDPQTFNIDPTLLEQAITTNTKAILPVHLYGQPCDMDAIVQIAARHGVPIVEDCAQAIGATYRNRKVGSFGAAGCFSFFPSKNLGCFGDGGMVVTDDDRLAKRIEMLRRHGGRVKYHHSELGLNSRLDEMQAAILRVKLKHLDAWNARRREIAYRYNALLEDADVVLPRELGADHTTGSSVVTAVYHQYTIQVERRDETAEALREVGIQSFPYYPVPLHLQEVHADLGHQRGDFPVAEGFAERCLSLPIYPELDSESQRRVATELLRATRSACAAA